MRAAMQPPIPPSLDPVLLRPGDFVAVDIDDCFRNGELSLPANEIVKRLATYTERSISGTGLHALMAGHLPGRGRKLPGFELYGNKRFIITRLPIAGRGRSWAW